MFSVALVEDSDRDSALLHRYLESYAQKHQMEITIACFENASLFLKDYVGYDIVFMDIDLPGIHGMDAARLLRSVDTGVLLVFVTALARFAVNGYEVNAFDFLVKPMEYSLFAVKMDRCIRELAVKDESRVLIHTPKRNISLRFNDIIYVEINGHQLTFHTMRTEITTRGKIRDVMAAMDGGSFVMCNKWCIVNLRFVEQIDGGNVILMGGVCLPIARTRKTEFIQQIANFYGNKKVNMGRF